MNNFTLYVYDAKMYMLITSTKMASTYLMNYYNQIDTPVEQNLFQINYTPTDGWLADPLNDSLKDSSAHINLTQFLNKGSIKKDVIILIRDPWSRFLSAFIEDYIKPLFLDRGSFHLLGSLLLESGPNCPGFEESEIEEYKKNWNTPQIFEDLHPDESTDFGEHHLKYTGELMNVIYALTYRRLSQYDFKVFQVNHNKYHSLISNILNTSKQKNLLIVDIDKYKIDTLLNKYEIGITKNTSELWYSAKGMKQVLKKVLLSKDDTKIGDSVTMIEEALEDETLC